MSLTGYKIASTKDGKSALVTLDIGSDSNTNLYRKDIVDKLHAKYRCDKATVISIVICDTDEPVTCAYTCIYKDKRIKYVVGEEVVEPSYNKDINVVCGEGIHFFLSKEIAMLYGLDKVENGVHKRWWNNGQLMDRAMYVEGKLNGEYKAWHENGQLWKLGNYVEDKLHGEYKAWHDNGQLMDRAMYVEGKLHGEYKALYDNGQLMVQTTYVEGKLHGEYKRWHDNGQLWVQKNYTKGYINKLKDWFKSIINKGEDYKCNIS